MLRYLFATLATVAFLLAAPRFAGAQSDGSGAPCPVIPGALDASAGGTALSAGTFIVSHTGASPSITLRLAGSGTPIALAGDRAVATRLPNGDTQVVWTLADPARAFRFLNVTSPSGTRPVVAINLRGIAGCVESADGKDTIAVKLPNGLGTARFRFDPQNLGSIAVSATDGDIVALDGTLNAADLSGTLRVSGRVGGSTSPLGTASFTANGLDAAGGGGDAVRVPTPAGTLLIAGVNMHLAASGSRIAASVTPPLPAALPFTFDGAQGELLRAGDGTLAVRCTANAPAHVTKPLLGAAPNLTVRLGTATDDSVVVVCDGTGRYSAVRGILALTWPHAADAEAVSTSFRFTTEPGQTAFTPVDGSLRPIRFDVFGVDASLEDATLGAGGSELRLSGNVTLGLRALPIVTAKTALTVAVRAAGEQPTLAILCTASTPPGAGKGITLGTVCDGTTVVGVRSNGGSWELPLSAGSGSISIPSFAVTREGLKLDGEAACAPAKATTPKAFMQFGSMTIATCSLAYDGTNGLKVTLGGSLQLPEYLIAKGSTLNVSNAVVAYRPKARAYGVTGLDANLTPPADRPLTMFGMQVGAFRNTADSQGPCFNTSFAIRARTESDDAFDQPLKLTLCAELWLPDYLSFETKARVGLLKDGVIQPQTARKFLHFDGLTFGPAGIDPPDVKLLTADPDCNKPKTGLDDAHDMFYDCRAWANYATTDENAPAPSLTLGPLSLSNLRLNLVAQARGKEGKLVPVDANAPQFHFTSEVTFAKYISSDGPTGRLSADFDHSHMLLLGEFSKPVTVRAGVASLGLQSFQMELDSTKRRFEAGGVSVSSEGSAGVNSLALYFKQISFLETNDGSGWKLKRIAAPVDVPKTAIGLAYRLFSDLGASSFLRLFGLR
ncbi:MAG TPA: hypothetical protein VGD01_19375 [Candidatus Elarobacter sp.]|jgi:hypothetical protein